MEQRVENDRFTIMLLVLALIPQTSHSLQICLFEHLNKTLLTFPSRQNYCLIVCYFNVVLFRYVDHKL